MQKPILFVRISLELRILCHDSSKLGNLLEKTGLDIEIASAD